MGGGITELKSSLCCCYVKIRSAMRVGFNRWLQAFGGMQWRCWRCPSRVRLQPWCIHHMCNAWSSCLCRTRCSQRIWWLPWGRISYVLSFPHGKRTVKWEMLVHWSEYDNGESILGSDWVNVKWESEKVETMKMPKTMSTKRDALKKGPRKLKSLPLFTAQNVYRVRPATAAPVRMKASNMIFPVGNPNSTSSWMLMCNLMHYWYYYYPQQMNTFWKHRATKVTATKQRLHSNMYAKQITSI